MSYSSAWMLYQHTFSRAIYLQIEGGTIDSWAQQSVSQDYEQKCDDPHGRRDTGSICCHKARRLDAEVTDAGVDTKNLEIKKYPIMGHSVCGQ
eukprot:scaffold78570_cov57-Attheya_sp.AAC.3